MAELALGETLAGASALVSDGVCGPCCDELAAWPVVLVLLMLMAAGAAGDAAWCRLLAAMLADDCCSTFRCTSPSSVPAHWGF